MDSATSQPSLQTKRSVWKVKLMSETSDLQVDNLLKLMDVSSVSIGVSWELYRGLDVVVAMVTSQWGAWAFSPCGLLLVICSSLCSSQEPYIKPADCSRKEHPVVSYQCKKPGPPGFNICDPITSWQLSAHKFPSGTNVSPRVFFSDHLIGSHSLALYASKHGHFRL